MRKVLSTLFFCCCLLIADNAFANGSIRIIGRDSAKVTTRQVRLADIASVSSKDPADDEAILALQKIVIADSPLPGKSNTITGHEILSVLQGEGVDLNKVGFSFKRVMEVSRVARALSRYEVQSAIEQYLSDNLPDSSIKDLQYRENVKVVPGTTNLKVAILEKGKQGRTTFGVIAEVENEVPVQFQVKATLEEWLELPVAARALKKGAVISEDDLKMAKLNMSMLSKDVASDRDNLIGLELDRSIGAGEVFHLNRLAEPPVISKGSNVILMYKTRLLTATAEGVAIENGQSGDVIKVKNSASKKIVRGTVIEPGLVEVR